MLKFPGKTLYRLDRDPLREFTSMNSFPPSMVFLTEQLWLILIIGVLVASLAFLMGRRLFIARARRIGSIPPDDLVKAALSTEQLDRRSTPRRKGNLIEVYLTDDSKRLPLHGWVVDRSVGGLCLVVDKPLTEGTILNVRPRKAPQTAPWTSIEIRSCRADRGDWEVGCRFVKAPAWNDLLLFG
jgi:PilZ domain